MGPKDLLGALLPQQEIVAAGLLDRRGRRKVDQEFRALAQALALGANRAAVDLNDGFADRKPEPQTFTPGPPCSNASKIRSRNCGSIPIPLSLISIVSESGL